MSITNLLKEGTKYLSGLDEAILKNIDAVRELSDILKTSLGPCGMNKLIINKLDKLFVTSDAATIIKQLELVHPAAKLCVMASEQQEQEIGDSTNLVIIFCGELLSQAESLLRMGLHPSDIVQGYERAMDKVNEIIDDLSVYSISDFSNESDITNALRGPIGAKQYGYEQSLTPLVVKACMQVLPKTRKHFDVDNIRVIKVVGGGIHDSFLVKGAVLKGDTEGSIKSRENVEVVVYSGGIQDLIKPDTQSVINVTNPGELQNYNLSEEIMLEERIKAIAESGVGVVVSGGAIGELAMHYFEQHNIMVVRSSSKFEIKRICVATGARSLTRLDAPNPRQKGKIDKVNVNEVGSTKLVYFENEKEESKLVSIILRAATENLLDDIERAVDDGVNTFKAMSRIEGEVKFLPGAGACEIEMARLIKSFGESVSGQDQYAIQKFSEALEIVPKILAENSGANPTDIISKLYSLHSEGKVTMGVDVNGNVVDSREIGIYDLLVGKRRALELATNAAVTILRISQLIMARQSEMPNPPQPGVSDPDPY